MRNERVRAVVGRVCSRNHDRCWKPLAIAERVEGTAKEWIWILAEKRAEVANAVVHLGEDKVHFGCPTHRVELQGDFLTILLLCDILVDFVGSDGEGGQGDGLICPKLRQNSVLCVRRGLLANHRPHTYYVVSLAVNHRHIERSTRKVPMAWVPGLCA